MISLRFFAGLLATNILLFAGCASPSPEAQPEVTTDSVKTTQNPKLTELNNQILQNPNNAQLYADRASIYVLNNQFDEAVNDLQRSIKLDSTQADFYVLLATLQFRNRKPAEAMTLVKKAVQVNPNHVPANLKLGEMFMYAENYEKAFEHINLALKQDVYNAEGYFLKGMIYKLTGDTAKAVSSFQTCVEQNADFYDAYLQLGLIYAAAQNNLALAYYNNALQVRPNSTEAMYNKAMFLQSMQQFSEADLVYKQILQIDPNYYIAYYNMGYLRLVYTEDYDSAAHLFTLAIDNDPQYFEAYYNRGYAYELMENNAKAIADYKKALEIQPDFTLAAKGIGRLQ